MAVQPDNFAMIIIILVDLLALTAAQSVAESIIFDPTNCLNTVVTMSSCTSMLDKQKSCAHIDNPSSQADCYCQQSVLNYMAGCHQQMWDCFPNSMIDSLFEGTTGFYYSWSTVCQEVLTFSPTTMIITKPPAYDQEDCLSYAMDCDSLTVAMTSCNSAYNTPGTDLNGCLCNEDMLYWGSRCDIDANQSCLRKTLDPTAVYSNRYCGRTAQSGSASRTSPASSSTVSRLEPTSSYVPPAPSSVAGAGAAATSGPTGSGVARQAGDRSSAIAAFALVVAVFFA